MRCARRGRSQGGAAVRRVEAAAAGPLHRGLAGRRERALPHRESARALWRPPARRTQPRLSGRHAPPLRRLLLPGSRRAGPCTRGLGLGLGRRRWLGWRRARSRRLDPAARLGPGRRWLGCGPLGRALGGLPNALPSPGDGLRPWRLATPLAVPPEGLEHWPHPLRSPETSQSWETSPLETDQAPPLLDSGFPLLPRHTPGGQETLEVP